MLSDLLRLSPGDAELLLSTLELGGKGSDPEKAAWFKSALARRLLGRNDWIDLPRAMKECPADLKRHIFSCMPKWSRELLSEHIRGVHPNDENRRQAMERIAAIANEMIAAGMIRLIER